ncbi:hypothetical protein D3C76_1402040 [compost metagenome]
MRLVRLRGNQRRTSRAVAGDDALQQTKSDQHVHVGGEPHTPNDDRHPQAGAEQHRFTAVFIGRKSPNRRENR